MTSPPADPHSTTLGPDPLVDQLRAADTLRQQQRWPEALAAYRSILLDNPHIAVVAHNIAVCHMALRQYPQAEQHAQLAQRLGPQLWQSGLIAAKAQHLQGMAIQGLQTLYQLSERHPNNRKSTSKSPGATSTPCATPKPAPRPLNTCSTTPTLAPRRTK